jgi:glycerol-3-phosphate dehydrogenase (NAD(P)+)
VKNGVAVIGAGSWGTAVAALACANAPTVLWARRADLADELATKHTNSAYLGDDLLPDDLAATAELDEAVGDATVVVMAVPSHGFRQILSDAAPAIAAGVPIISLSKGVEQGTLKRMTEVVAEVLPGHPAGVLTGPNLAKEVRAGHPAASVVGLEDTEIAGELQRLFSGPSFRVYTNPDVIGCEVGGALKNVMAIAAGMADGMGFGDNTKATLMTRGLAELTRLGVALGGQPLTFSGLAGMGDLVATCMSRQSRNRHVGEELGKGRTLDEIIAEMNMVAEGVKTTRAVVDLAAKVGIEMPIAEQVNDVLDGTKTAAEVIPLLMQRQAKPELHGIEG